MTEHDHFGNVDGLEARLRGEADEWRRKPSVGIGGRTATAIAAEEGGERAVGFKGGGDECRAMKSRSGWLADRRSWLALAAAVVVVVLGGGSLLVMTGLLDGGFWIRENETTVAVVDDGERVGVLRAIVFEPIGDALVDVSRYVASSTESSLEAESAVWRGELRELEERVRRRLPWLELRGGGDGDGVRGVEDRESPAQ